MSEIKLGDYVFASKYSDGDPNDPWRVGFVCKITHTWKRGKTRYVIGEEDGTWSDHREYNHARVITREEGDEICRDYPGLEVTPPPP